MFTFFLTNESLYDGLVSCENAFTVQSREVYYKLEKYSRTGFCLIEVDVCYHTYLECFDYNCLYSTCLFVCVNNRLNMCKVFVCFDKMPRSVVHHQ